MGKNKKAASGKTETQRPKKHRGLRILLRILAGLLILLLCLALTLFIIPLTETESQKTTAGSADWMSELPGDLSLTEITIPGTHDSATRYAQLAFVSKCQALSIGEQLEAGYRYLDIRLGIKDGHMRLMHGFVNCKTGAMPWASALELDLVLDDCYAFLEKHPTETVIFAVKQEHGNETADEFASCLNTYLEKRPEMWLKTEKIPKLDEARGKLVLFRRYELTDSQPENGIPMLWEQQNGHYDTALHTVMTENGSYRLWVQDRYEYGNDDKWIAFLAGLSETQIEEQDAEIHFLSTKGTLPYGHPYGHAKDLNARLMDRPSTELHGWIIVDFASAPLAEHIYRANQKLSNREGVEP